MTIPVGYCQCGCGQKTAIAHANVPAYGYVRGEPKLYLRNHAKRKRERWRAEDHGYDTPCLIWQLYRDPEGYGRVKAGHEVLVHRIAWIERNGPIPQGFEIHHKCGQRPCINVDHLELVSPSDHQKNRHSVRAKQTHCKRGHELRPDTVRVSQNRGKDKRSCLICVRARDRQYKREARQRSKALTPESTQTSPRGARVTT